jgi:hypothetical protein
MTMGRLYDRIQWKRVKASQLEREPFCRACAAAGALTPAVEVDHIVPLARGGAAVDRSNLQSLCKRHHSIKTHAFDKQGKDWRQWAARGCDEHGWPRDPQHEWNQEMGGVPEDFDSAQPAMPASNFDLVDHGVS